MARRFTFGAGNAGKLVRLPLYGLGALAAVVVPRSRRRWVIGSGIGLGEGALPFLRLAVDTVGASSNSEDPIRIVWLARTPTELAEARAAGYESEIAGSARGLWATLRSRVVVVTHGFGDVNRFGLGGAIIVQLWHGIPLKRLHLDSPEALRVAGLPSHPLVRRAMAVAYRAAGRRIALFPVAGAAVAPRIATAFGIPADRIVPSGDPRDDVLLAGEPEARRERAREAIEAAVGPLGAGPLILYAPTWRDGDPDPGAPSAADWRAIGALLADTDATMLVRTHPLGSGDYAEGPATSERIRMLGPAVLREVTPVLPAIDDLITDYSSIAYDHALTGGRQVFYAPDLEGYAKRRGLYGSYRDFTGGRHAVDWPGVISALDAPRSQTSAHTRWLVDEHVDHLDGRATERVLAATLRRAGEPVPPELVAAETDAGSARPELVGVEVVGDEHSTALRVALRGAPVGTTAVRLQGARARVERAVSTIDVATGELVVELPLLSTRWGDPGLPLPSGPYRLQILVEGREPSARFEVTAALARAAHPLFAAEPVADGGGLTLRIGPPLADDERGVPAQRRLERRYRRSDAPAENAVFLESFYGRTVACNPLGIDQALASIRPDVRRYWSTIDASVAIPEGATRIIEGSAEWWRVRASARVLIVNDWLRKRWRRRAHQRVLQTWHGTMLKHLALDRPGISARTRLAILRERSRWDLLLAQNSYAEEIFRSAYAFRRPIWQEGYPRDDVLSTGDPAEVRRRLGVADGIRIVLYAPTWRDDREEIVDYLDLETFAEDLDEGTVLLVRGHSRTLPFGRDLEGTRLLDVTGYPNVSDLLLVADVLVTDYSSVMFDWASTERPIVFFTPDLAHYAQQLRGFYFDLLAEAPGPVVDTREGLLEVLSDVAVRTDVFTGARTAWHERFAPHDDGGSGERVVRRLTEEGLL